MPESETPKPSSEETPVPAPYELAPVEEVPTARPASAASKAGGSAARGEPRGQLKAPGLISDFDEDADFSKDPELEARVKGASGAKGVGAVGSGATVLPGIPGVDGVPMVRDGIGHIKWWAIAGGVAALAAAITAAITTKGQWYSAGLATIFATAFHSGTGLAALAIAGYFLERPLGKLDEAAARMLVAVGAFAIFFHIDTTVMARMDETALAMGAYLGVVLGLFRVHGGEALLLGVTHGVLWGLIALGQVISRWAAAGVPVTPTP